MQKANFLELLIAAAIGLTLCYFSYQHFTNFENDVLDCPACVIEKTNQTNEEKINRINELTIQIEEVQK